MTFTIISNFPHLITPKIKGKPDRESINKLEKIIQENAAATQTNLGGVQHGYLGLTMTDPACNLVTGTNLEHPNNPGLTSIMPNRETQHQILQIQNFYSARAQQHNEFLQIERALRNQIINAIEKIYIEALEEDYVRYNNHSMPDMLKYLYDTYGIIRRKDLQNNEKNLLNNRILKIPSKVYSNALKSGKNCCVSWRYLLR